MPTPIILKAQIELLHEARTSCLGVFNTIDDQKTMDLLQHSCEMMTLAEFQLQSQLDELSTATASY